MDSPIFPVEIIYEINSHIPFDSFMWILSKDTHKYWSKKTLYSDRITQEDKKRNIDLLILRSSRDLEQIKLINEIIRSVKTVVLSGRDTSTHLYRLHNKKHSVQAINFGGWLAEMSLMSGLNGISITNYEIHLGPDSRDFVLSRMPQAFDLFETYMNSYDSWTREDFKMHRNWHIEIKKDKVITHVTEHVILHKPKVLELSEHLYLDCTDPSYSVCDQVAQELIAWQNLKSCIIKTFSSIRKADYKRILRNHIKSKLNPKIIII